MDLFDARFLDYSNEALHSHWLLTSMELILGPNCSLLLLLKKSSISINVIFSLFRKYKTKCSS